MIAGDSVRHLGVNRRLSPGRLLPLFGIAPGFRRDCPGRSPHVFEAQTIARRAAPKRGRSRLEADSNSPRSAVEYPSKGSRTALDVLSAPHSGGIRLYLSPSRLRRSLYIQTVFVRSGFYFFPIKSRPITKRDPNQLRSRLQLKSTPGHTRKLAV